jgi:uncharacterized protein (TIGR00299 family) protein
LIASSAPPGPTVAWFNCFAGIAGDMALGSLLDAGADVEEVVALVRRLPIGAWSLETEAVLRAGLSATRAVVRGSDDIVVRTYSHIVGLIEEARLPERVRRRSLAAFRALAEAEGRLHGRPAAQVHFHEVGSQDAIVDIVGTCSAMEVLGVEEVSASPVTTGTGLVRTSHGVMPNPSPAVVEILRGAPLRGRDLNVELTTPTGACLLAATVSAYGPLPPMTVAATGYGAGARELDELPNCTQVVVGTGSAEAAGGGHQAALVELNVDDATGEVLAHAVAAALEAGALDAWVTPVLMKKGRPGHVVSALCDPALAGALAGLLRSETGSLGARSQLVQRWPASRRPGQVEVAGLPVRVKVSPGRVKAEQADAARVARRTGLPLREVIRQAEGAWPPEDGGAGPPGEGPGEAG